MKRGFTLLELIVVIIIVGILAALAFAQYTTVVEKGRAGEAKMILGQLRTAETLYVQQYGGTGTADFAYLPVDLPAAADSYFAYTCAATGICTADRRTSGGKAPDISVANDYTLSLAVNGTVGGTGAAKYW